MDWNRQSRPDDVAYPSAHAFVLVHLACLAAIWTGISWDTLALSVGLYWLRIFAIGAGYHRYFSHKAYRTSRTFQLILAFLAQTSAQRGVLWWAAKHRLHHKHSDTERDPHSPVQRGFLYAHFGWIFVPNNDTTDYAVVRDLTRFPELIWLNRQTYTPAIALGLACWAFAGWGGLVVGFCWSTVAVWHATFSINSLAHLAGRRRYVTGDHSRNNWLLALITMGEGWHNNHHAYQASVRQGFRWWEYDPTFYALRILAWCGVIWDLHQPPRLVVSGQHRLGRMVIDKAAAQLAASFPVNHIADQVVNTYAHHPGWGDLKARLLSARLQAESFWKEFDPPDIPSLDEVRRYARDRMVTTPSLDEIAERARERLLDLIYLQVVAAAASR